MSDKENPFSVLWDSEILAVKQLPLTVIPHAIQDFEDDFEGSSSVVIEESFDILKEDIRYGFVASESKHLKSESPSCVLQGESCSFSSDRKSRARESSNEKVGVWNVSSGNISNVSSVRLFSEISRIDFPRSF